MLIHTQLDFTFVIICHCIEVLYAYDILGVTNVRKLYSVLLTAFSSDQVLQSRGSTNGACYLGGGILSLAEHEAVQTCLI